MAFVKLATTHNKKIFIMPAPKKTNRKAQILQALAGMLETHHGQRIT
ncbi:MAG: hypothetical protein ACI9RV_002125, partial [Glaciecola sp.]